MYFEQRPPVPADIPQPRSTVYSLPCMKRAANRKDAGWCASWLFSPAESGREFERRGISQLDAESSAGDGDVGNNTSARLRY
jgi:hypothetical protein